MNIKKDFYPFSFIKFFILLFFIIHFSLTIDRINNDKNYSPDNCRWTNYKIQLSNTSRTHHIRYDNKKYNIRELSNLLNISYDKLYYRIIQLGWDVDKTINYYNRK